MDHRRRDLPVPGRHSRPGGARRRSLGPGLPSQSPYNIIRVTEKVCNELNRIHLIEFNAIGFDLIEFNSISFNRICLWTGPAGTSAAPITDAGKRPKFAKGPDMHRPVAAVKVLRDG